MAVIKEILKRAEKSEKSENPEEEQSPLTEQAEEPLKAEKKASAKKTEKTQKSDKTGTFMKELLSGTMVSEKIILKNLGYVAMLTFLLVLYIGNRFNAEKITRESTRLQREVKDLRSESLSTSADLMYVSKQSEVYKLVKQKGLSLEELKAPAYKLLVSK
jgi:predicted lipid-binding transport protein (Tim44 family)